MCLTQTLAIPQVVIDGADVSETLEGDHPDATSKVTELSAADSLVYELVDVFEELTVPPIVADSSARVERQLRFADEDGRPGRATKARVSVAERH